MTTLDTGTDDLQAAVDDGVAVLTLNRPERRNAFSPAMLEVLGEALHRETMTLPGASPTGPVILRRGRTTSLRRGGRSNNGCHRPSYRDACC